MKQVKRLELRDQSKKTSSHNAVSLHSKLGTLNSRSARAFTLIETFVAITVLLVSLVGPMTIAALALKTAYYARDEVSAFFLAQEALEYVRAVRDQNYLAGQGWLTGLDQCVNAPCTIDFPNFNHAACANGVCTPVLLSPTTKLFNMAAGDPSLFTRTVVIEPVAGTPDEVIIRVTISWLSANINRTFQLQEHLFNWL